MEVVITNTALEEFCRVAGCEQTEEARETLLELFRDEAHFVRVQHTGAELWRSRRRAKPRLSFIVHVERDGDDAGKHVVAHILEGRTFRVEVWDGPNGYQAEAVEQFYERGPERRVAVRLRDGRWAEGRRGKRGEVETFAIHAGKPAWVDYVARAG